MDSIELNRKHDLNKESNDRSGFDVRCIHICFVCTIPLSILYVSEVVCVYACDCDNHYTAVHNLWKYWACRPHNNPSYTRVGIVSTIIKIIDE